MDVEVDEDGEELDVDAEVGDECSDNSKIVGEEVCGPSLFLKTTGCHLCTQGLGGGLECRPWS